MTPSIGLDFGTSNTVVSLATPDGRVETLRFPHPQAANGVFASALCFWQERRGLPAQAEGGPWAFERLLDHSGALRFLQSFKTLAASRSFQSTMVFGQRYGFEDILAAFLRTLVRRAGTAFDFSAARVVIGRPVNFAGAAPDDALAMQRYAQGFARLGIADATYAYEPVGAAFSFAQTLDRDATLLVADFGGGTSDFSVMRFAREGGALRAQPLAASGVGVAGDSFDYRIVERVVAPRLGKGGEYRSFGKVLPLPNHYFARLARWHELALLKGSAEHRELRELARDAVDPRPLQDFLDLVEHDLGLQLYRAVSAAKLGLSASEAVDFRFADGDIDIRARLTRPEFESWIAEDLARIEAAVDRALAQAGLTPDGVDRVFLTGGTSFVPAVRRLFAARFGEDKLTAAEPFESISRGLALIGQTAEPGRWAAPA